MRELNAKERKAVRSAYLNPKDYVFACYVVGGIWVQHKVTGAQMWLNATDRSAKNV
jgi:hypothetical protein